MAALSSKRFHKDFQCFGHNEFCLSMTFSILGPLYFPIKNFLLEAMKTVLKKKSLTLAKI